MATTEVEVQDGTAASVSRSTPRELATVEVLGALAYGLLRSFDAVARVVRLAPDADTADTLAGLAVREHTAYTGLRDHLTSRTDLTAAVMDRQKPHFDAYFDRLPLDDWFGACTFFATGLPIAADFGRAIAPALDEDAGTVVIQALADRETFEAFALERLAIQLVDDDARERARGLAADLLGRALTSFQGVIADTDALKVLLAAEADHEGTSAESQVKQLAISVLAGHRRRVVALGLEDLDAL